MSMRSGTIDAYTAQLLREWQDMRVERFAAEPTKILVLATVAIASDIHRSHTCAARWELLENMLPFVYVVKVE